MKGDQTRTEREKSVSSFASARRYIHTAFVTHSHGKVPQLGSDANMCEFRCENFFEFAIMLCLLKVLDLMFRQQSETLMLGCKFTVFNQSLNFWVSFWPVKLISCSFKRPEELLIFSVVFILFYVFKKKFSLQIILHLGNCVWTFNILSISVSLRSLP